MCALLCSKSTQNSGFEPKGLRADGHTLLSLSYFLLSRGGVYHRASLSFLSCVHKTESTRTAVPRRGGGWGENATGLCV